MKTAASWQWELKWRNQDKQTIVGLDEVGRGCWAGPLVAAVYQFDILPTEIELFDSKVITEPRRISLAHQLQTLGIFAIGLAQAHEIDSLGLQQAQYLAYTRALAQIPTLPDIILLDGRPWHDCPYQHEAIIDGDALVASIASASIIAKVHRDTLMKTIIHEQHPHYGFNQHVGYGTKQHQAAIATHGISPQHRTSYKPIKSIIEA